MDTYKTDINSIKIHLEDGSIKTKEDYDKASEVKETIKFIRLISQRPPLFNYQMPIEVRKRSAVKKLWMEVSNLMGSSYSVFTCRKKWRNLRDTYHQYRLRKSKLHDGSFQRWRYSKELDFLKSIYKSKPKKNSEKLVQIMHGINSEYKQEQDSPTSSQNDMNQGGGNFVVSQVFLDNSHLELQPSSEDTYEMSESVCILDDDMDDGLQTLNEEEHLVDTNTEKSNFLGNNVQILKHELFKNEEPNEFDQLTQAERNQSQDEIDLYFHFLKMKVSKLPPEDVTDIQIEFLNIVRQREIAQLKKVPVLL